MASDNGDFYMQMHCQRPFFLNSLHGLSLWKVDPQSTYLLPGSHVILLDTRE